MRPDLMRHRTTLLALPIVLPLGLGLSGTALAWSVGGNVTLWNVAASGLWNDPARWTSGVPAPADTAAFGLSASSGAFTVTLENSVTVDQFLVSSQSPSLDCAGATCTVTTLARIGGPAEAPPVASVAGGKLVVTGALAIGSDPDTEGSTAGTLVVHDLTLKAGSIAVGATTGSVGVLEAGPNVLKLGTFTSSTLALGAAGQGTLEAHGSGGELAFNTIELGSIGSPLGGLGRVEVRDGATVTFVKAKFGPPVKDDRSTLAVSGPGSILAMDQPNPSNAIVGPKTISIADGGTFRPINLTLTADDRTRFEIGPHGPGLINNLGSLTLGGALEVTFAPGFIPPSGASFPLAATFFLFGGFDSISTPTVNGQPLQLLTFGTSVVLVTPSFDSEVVVAPSSLDIRAGVFTLLQAQTSLPDGTHYLFNADVTWQSLDPSIATVTPAGVVVGVGAGTTTIRMTSGAITVDVPTTVRPGLASPELVCASVTAEGIPAGGSADPAGYGAVLPRCSLSDNGRFVAFHSDATLVANDTNAVRDIYVRDIESGTTSRVSVATDGTQANADSSMPAITPDGRFVTFTSSSANLIPGLPTGGPRVYLHDRLTGTTELVTQNGKGTMASDDCRASAISADGRYVAWIGRSGGLTVPPGDEALSAFRKDRWTGEVIRVAVTFEGADADVAASSIAISDDGERVAFISSAAILRESPTGAGQAYVRHVPSGAVFAASRAPFAGPTEVWSDATPTSIALDGSGHIVSFVAEAPSLTAPASSPVSSLVAQHFVADELHGTLQFAASGPDGLPGNYPVARAALSRSGRYAGTLTHLPLITPYFSERTVALRKDLLTGAIEVCSLNANGLFNASVNGAIALSADGSRMAFSTRASNVVPGDTPSTTDLFTVWLGAAISGDLDEDGAVGPTDLALLLAAWGTSGGGVADPDLNHDGIVDSIDLALLLGAWSSP